MFCKTTKHSSCAKQNCTKMHTSIQSIFVQFCLEQENSKCKTWFVFHKYTVPVSQNSKVYTGQKRSLAPTCTFKGPFMCTFMYHMKIYMYTTCTTYIHTGVHVYHIHCHVHVCLFNVFLMSFHNKRKNRTFMDTSPEALFVIFLLLV
jgi:hypothetical protein